MNRQHGFTLVELMISSVIGLIIMAGMMNLFITVNKSVTLSDALSKNQETGRFAMEYLTKNLRKASYSEDPKIVISALLIPANSITCTSAPESEACAANNPSNARGDRLSIPFYVAAGAEARSCTGTVLTGPALAANVFWVSNETDTDRELLCRTYGMTDGTTASWLDNAVSIITNIEALEFQVGVALARANKEVGSYVSVDRVTDPELIRSIKVSLLTTSQDATAENKISTNKMTRTYSLMDAPYRVITDGNLRNLFINTVELANMIETADENEN